MICLCGKGFEINPEGCGRSVVGHSFEEVLGRTAQAVRGLVRPSSRVLRKARLFGKIKVCRKIADVNRGRRMMQERTLSPTLWKGSERVALGWV